MRVTILTIQSHPETPATGDFVELGHKATVTCNVEESEQDSTIYFNVGDYPPCKEAVTATYGTEKYCVFNNFKAVGYTSDGQTYDGGDKAVTACKGKGRERTRYCPMLVRSVFLEHICLIH